jgi:spermidine/putrescine ABC transporter ATP-binding subunit
MASWVTVDSPEGARVDADPVPERLQAIGASLSLQHLSKRYGDAVAVDDLSLQVRPGEFVSLLGPSGSGKTTTLMAVAGFQRLDGGRITVADRDITNLPPHRRNVGVVFQNYALFPHLTVRENVAYPLKMHGTPTSDIPARVAEALELVRLADYAHRRPRQLSGGQQQRVALARAVVFRPPLVLMDEPLGALDRQLRERLQFEIKNLQRALGMTVVYVTHDQEEALTMSDRVAVMNKGVIEQVGTPEEVYQQPASRFVASFVGESNEVTGTVVAAHPDGRVTVRSDGGEEVTGVAADPVPVGSPAAAAIRPERLGLVRSGDPRAGDGADLGVRCEHATYMGNRHRYEFVTPRGQRFVVYRSVQDGGPEPPPVGAGTILRWNPQDMRVYAIAGAADPAPGRAS